MSNFTFQGLLAKTSAWTKQNLPKLQKSLTRLGQNLSSIKTDNQPSNPATVKSKSAQNLQAKVKAELLEAWNFIQDELVPVLVNFVVVIVTKIDPPLSAATKAASSKFVSNPTIQTNWQKLQTTSLWQKTFTALAPVGRSLQNTIKPLTTSTILQPIVTRPLGTLAFAVILSLLLSLKPHSGATANAPINSDIAISKSVDIPAEKGDTPISPEKVLVSSIQAQVSDISKVYGEALIASVQTNFKLGRLMIQLSDAWYQLNPEQQEQLVTDLKVRSQALSFKKLFLLDTSQHLLARSPAIGSGEMIILRS
jgi:hypothetical protein